MSVTLDHLKQVYHQPFFNLIEEARSVYCARWKNRPFQLCSLINLKAGGCSEDCAYCAQSSRYSSGVKPGKLMSVEKVLAETAKAKANGATRICMGTAWRGIQENDPRFASVVEIVREVSNTGLEVCITLGQISEKTAAELKSAGLTVYNHNLDTSPDFFPRIVSTHGFDDRMETIRNVQKAGLKLCCGGIVGMGESVEDRLKMLAALAELTPPPDSVPINCLVPIPGTPLEKLPPVDIFELVRLIATTRITFPDARVRLSAGRLRLSREGQALCFLAGANSIFFGTRLLTTDNPCPAEDVQLLNELDLLPENLRTSVTDPSTTPS
jgi:biotin synthase